MVVVIIFGFILVAMFATTVVDTTTLCPHMNIDMTCLCVALNAVISIINESNIEKIVQEYVYYHVLIALKYLAVCLCTSIYLFRSIPFDTTPRFTFVCNFFLNIR